MNENDNRIEFVDLDGNKSKQLSGMYEITYPNGEYVAISVAEWLNTMTIDQLKSLKVRIDYHIKLTENENGVTE